MAGGMQNIIFLRRGGSVNPEHLWIPGQALAPPDPPDRPADWPTGRPTDRPPDRREPAEARARSTSGDHAMPGGGAAAPGQGHGAAQQLRRKGRTGPTAMVQRSPVAALPTELMSEWRVQRGLGVSPHHLRGLHLMRATRKAPSGATGGPW